MKALILAAVMALGASSASAVLLSDLLRKGKIITEQSWPDRRQKMVFLTYDLQTYQCTFEGLDVSCYQLPDEEVQLLRY